MIDLWESLGFNNDVDVVVENNGDDLNDDNCDEIIIIDDMENTQMFLQQKQQQCISNNNNNNQMIKSTNRTIDEQQQQQQKHIESSSIGEHILKVSSLFISLFRQFWFNFGQITKKKTAKQNSKTKTKQTFLFAFRIS